MVRGMRTPSLGWLVLLAACSETPATPPVSPVPAQPAVSLSIAPLAASPPVAVDEPARPKPSPKDPNVVLTLDETAPGTWSGTHANAATSPSGIWGDATHVFAVGKGTLMRSTDRGLHWTTARGPTDYPVVWGASIDDVWMGGGGVMRSTDRGATWTTMGPPIGNVYGIWGSGPDDVWVVGGSPAFAAHTTTHGQSWTNVKLPGKPLDWVYDVTGAGSDVWIVGKRRNPNNVEPAIFLSKDKGKTFGEIAPPKPNMTPNEQTRKVCVAPSGIVYVGMSYSLWATRDKGKTWKLATPVNTEVLSLACRDKHVVVGGRNRALFESRDDGASFQAVDLEHQIDGKLVSAQAAFIAPGGELYIGMESYDTAKAPGTLLRRAP